MKNLNLNMRTLKALVVTTGMAAVLSACGGTDRIVTGNIPNTYKDRHPIVVTEGLETLDLLPGAGAGGLSSRQRLDVRQYAREWEQRGRGIVVIQIPSGGANDAASQHALSAIRKELTAGGVPAGAITQTVYAASDGGHLAPIRIVYPRLKATVASKCGLWPDDLSNSVDLPKSMANQTYWNYGCAYQSNMAAMVDDPEDFVRPRAVDSASAARRSTVLGLYRQGQSTGTTYSDATSAEEVGDFEE